MYRDSPFRSTLNTSLTRTRTPTRAVFDPVAKSQFLCFQCREKCPPRTIAHSTLQWDPAMAPSTPSKLVVTLPPNQSTLLPQSRFVTLAPTTNHSTLKWHPTMARSNGTTPTAPCNGALVPRPIRQSGSSPSPLWESRTPIAIAI